MNEAVSKHADQLADAVLQVRTQQRAAVWKGR
jgi:hypothetical protein